MHVLKSGEKRSYKIGHTYSSELYGWAVKEMKYGKAKTRNWKVQNSNMNLRDSKSMLLAPCHDEFI